MSNSRKIALLSVLHDYYIVFRLHLFLYAVSKLFIMAADQTDSQMQDKYCLI